MGSINRSEDFSYKELAKFLETPKTASEVQRRFKFKRRNDMTSIITHATFSIPIYEGVENGVVVYGLMENKN